MSSKIHNKKLTLDISGNFYYFPYIISVWCASPAPENLHDFVSENSEGISNCV